MTKTTTTKDAALAKVLGQQARREDEASTVKRQKLLILMDERKRRQAEKDLYFFAKHVLRYDKMLPMPHGEVCEFIQQNENEDTILLLPRGTYKSTISTVAFPMWLLVRDPNKRILITSAEMENSKGWLSEMRLHILHNDTFIKMYGNWVPKTAAEREKSWHARAIRIRPCTRHTGTNSVVASSHTVTKVSQHYDQVICDDLMNEKTASSRDHIQKVEDYLSLLIPIIDPMPKTDVRPRHLIGTRWGHDDVYARIRARDIKQKREADARGEKGKLHWKYMVRRAINKTTGELFFPQVISRKFLQDLEASGEMTKYQISCQYYNDPQPDDTKLFKIKDMGFWNQYGRTPTAVEFNLDRSIKCIGVNPREWTTIATVDLALSDSDQSDWTAIVVTSIDSEYRRFIRDVRRGRWSAGSEIIQQILEIHFLYQPSWWGIESNGFQLLIKQGLEARIKELDLHLNVHKLTHRNVQKPLRIRGIEPFWTDQGMYWKLPDDVLFDKILTGGGAIKKETLYNLLDQDSIGVLASEAERYPLTPTDDCLDALAHQVPWFRRPRMAKAATQKGQYGSFQWWQDQARKLKRASNF